MQDDSRLRTIRSPIDSTPSTAKIQRPANMQAYERSTELWFEDGTLVVLAGRVSFRVYRGIVAQNSPIFEDMLSIPQPADVELYEGCPVVELLDAPEDVLPFLKALHSVGYFDVSQPIQWSVLSGILRLSTKYQVDFLRQRTYEVLHRLYPTTLEEWDARDAYVNLETFEARPFAVYLLAKETNLPTLLPAALYLCADSQDINFILDGLDSFDRRHIELDWPDKKACIRARETLSIALRTRLFAFLTGQMDFPGCHRTSVCNNTRWKWLQGVEASLGSGVFSVSFPWAQYQNGVCDNCHRLSREHYAAERQKLWDELPVLFGLPPWDELRRAVDVGSRTLQGGRQSASTFSDIFHDIMHQLALYIHCRRSFVLWALQYHSSSNEFSCQLLKHDPDLSSKLSCCRRYTSSCEGHHSRHGVDGARFTKQHKCPHFD